MQPSSFRDPWSSFPPMYAWPRPVKYAVLGIGAALCLGAYGALLAALLSLVTLLAASA